MTLLTDEQLKIWLSSGATVYCTLNVQTGANVITPTRTTVSAVDLTTLLTGPKIITSMSFVAGVTEVTIYLTVDSTPLTHKITLLPYQALYYANDEWKWSEVGVDNSPTADELAAVTSSGAFVFGDGGKSNGFEPGADE